MLSVRNLRKTFTDATESSGVEFSLSMNGEVMMSTIKQMSNEGVFLSSLGRCWNGFNILDGDPLKYQIYTYEQCNAVVTSCCGKYLLVGLANHSIPVGKIKAQLFSLRDFLESEFSKLNIQSV